MALEPIKIPGPISVRDLADKVEESPIAVIKTLMAMGVMANINQTLDPDTAALAVEEMGHPVVLPGEEPEEVEEETPEEEPELEEPERPRTRKQRLYENEPADKLKPRPPVITVLGHVDHGKTTLLDAIREENVVAGEAGGITQHIGAYQVERQDRLITFIDTPGHEAFTAMRARGAQGADIAILVIAADDGVMPQTIEAYDHAKAAGIPIIVALTKIDMATARPQQAMQQAADQLGLLPEEWGGNTPFIHMDALHGEGIDELLDYIIIVTDINQENIHANPDRSAQGVVLESELDPKSGALATLLVLNGTLNRGDTVISGTSYGRIKAMFDEHGNQVKSAPPSKPVQILGLNDVPPAGQFFEVVENPKTARDIADRRTEAAEEGQRGAQRITLEDVFRQLQAGEREELNVIVKADMQGTLDAVVNSLEEIESGGDVSLRILHQGVGRIGENDVMLAVASEAIIVGYGVQADKVARERAENEGIQIRTYNVIYHLLEDMELALQGMLEPSYEEHVIGHAEVRATFNVRGGTVAGCYVRDGIIRRNAEARLIRNGNVVYEGAIANLKRFQDDVREVRQGYECGINLEYMDDYEVGDIIEVFEQREV